MTSIDLVDFWKNRIEYWEASVVFWEERYNRTYGLIEETKLRNSRSELKTAQSNLEVAIGESGKHS